MSAVWKTIHWFEHRFLLNCGYVHSWRGDDGIYYVGFKCSECGAVTDVVKSAIQDDYFERQIRARRESK